jgi:aspartate dehydrogenase
MSGPKTREPLRVGIAGLGAVGLEVARRLIAGVPGLKLTAVAVRDAEKARRALPQIGESIPVRRLTELADDCDIVVESLPPTLFRDVALSTIDKGRILMPLSVAQLLENSDLIERARQKGARILVPTGALIGLDAVRAAAEGTIHSVKMVTRKPPAGLEGAPYLRENGISVSGLKEPRTRGSPRISRQCQRCGCVESRRHRARPHSARDLGRSERHQKHSHDFGRCRYRALHNDD